jgi:hypothetical protein
MVHVLMNQMIEKVNTNLKLHASIIRKNINSEQ